IGSRAGPQGPTPYHPARCIARCPRILWCVIRSRSAARCRDGRDGHPDHRAADWHSTLAEEPCGLALADQGAELHVVYAQPHDNPRTTVVDNADMNDLPVLARPVDNPASCRCHALDTFAAPRARLMTGWLTWEPHPAHTGGRQMTRRDAESRRRTRSPGHN